MDKKIFLTDRRKEIISKLCINFSSILFASMLASEFFIKLQISFRILLLLLLLSLISLTIIIVPDKK